MPEHPQAPQKSPTFGRYSEIPPEQFSSEQKEAYDYILRERGKCPGPYRIWLQNPLCKLPAPVCTTLISILRISDSSKPQFLRCSFSDSFNCIFLILFCFVCLVEVFRFCFRSGDRPDRRSPGRLRRRPGPPRLHEPYSWP
jgi:hypothetical protein